LSLNQKPHQAASSLYAAVDRIVVKSLIYELELLHSTASQRRRRRGCGYCNATTSSSSSLQAVVIGRASKLVGRRPGGRQSPLPAVATRLKLMKANVQYPTCYGPVSRPKAMIHPCTALGGDLMQAFAQ